VARPEGVRRRADNKRADTHRPKQVAACRETPRGACCPCCVSHAGLRQFLGDEQAYGRSVPKKTCQASSDLAIKLKSM